MNSMFTKTVRIALGIMLLFFGANKFFQLYTLERPTDAVANSLIDNLEATGYFFMAVGSFEIIFGVLLLLKKWVPFVLMALFPITMNILLFHIILHIPNMGFAIAVAIFNLILIYKYWDKYKPLFD